MVPLLLLPLLWGGSLQEQPGYQLRVQESVTVQEGLCAHVPCSFSYPGSSWYYSAVLYTYWYQSRNYPPSTELVATNNQWKSLNSETRKRFHLSDPRSNNCSLTIRDARMSDTGIYDFRVERGYNVQYTYQDTQLNLQVTALTQKPHIRVPEPLVSGRPTPVTCSLPGSCEGGATLTFSWEGAAVDSLSPQTRRSSVLTFTPRPQDHGTSLSCRVTSVRPNVTLERSILLNVSYLPQLLGPSCSWEAQGLSCSCSSRAWPVPSLRWWLGEGLLEGNQSNTSYTTTSQSAGLWTNSSLSLRAGFSSGLRLSCEAWNVHGAQSVTVLLLPGSPNSWPLVFTLIRGALMGLGFLLTYGLTWLYYTRCGSPRSPRQSF